MADLFRIDPSQFFAEETDLCCITFMSLAPGFRSAYLHPVAGHTADGTPVIYKGGDTFEPVYFEGYPGVPWYCEVVPYEQALKMVVGMEDNSWNLHQRVYREYP